MQRPRSSRTAATAASLFSCAGKLASILGAAAAVPLMPALARAQLTGGQVVQGSATINTSGPATTITAANNTIINFQSYNIGQGMSVRYIQPGESSRVYNRGTAPDPTTIAGSRSTNGIVYITNSAGIFFA